MICVKCQTPTCSEHCWDCPAEGRGGRGDVRSSEYNDGYTRGLAERDVRVRGLEAALRVCEKYLDTRAAAFNDTSAASLLARIRALAADRKEQEK